MEIPAWVSGPCCNNQWTTYWYIWDIISWFQHNKHLDCRYWWLSWTAKPLNSDECFVIRWAIQSSCVHFTIDSIIQLPSFRFISKDVDYCHNTNLHVILGLPVSLAVDDSSHYYDNQCNQEHPTNYGYNYYSHGCSTHISSCSLCTTNSCTDCRNQKRHLAEFI